MDNTTNKEVPAATLRDVFNRLPPRNSAVRDTVARLKSKNIKVAATTVYGVIAGRSANAVVAAEFLDVAAEVLANTKRIQDRTTELASA